MDARSRNDWPLLGLLIAIVIGVNLLVGALIAPSAAWVSQLTMPPILMPRGVSAGIQLVLSIAFAVVGWRIWLLSPRLGLDMGLWAASLALGWLFTPAFLMIRAVAGAMTIIVLMVLIMGFLNLRLWRSDRLSAYLLAPSTLWVFYTAVLTGWVVGINRFPVA